MTSSNFKPLLACEAELDKLNYPLIASPKLDGIRCLIHPELGPVTRNLKPIANAALRAELAKLPAYLDGELIAGEPDAPDAMQKTSSAVMGKSGDWGDVRYYVFDSFCQPGELYTDRLELADYNVDAWCDGIATILDWCLIRNEAELMAYEAKCVECGFEGIMLRDPDGRYKYGRSTVKEGILLKLKRFHDMEGEVVGFVERMHNANEATKDELGRTKRSSSKKNKIGTGTLGALVLRISGWPSETVEVGSGFTEGQRVTYWQPEHRLSMLYKKVTFKYQKSGSKDAPRFPVFKGFREDV